MTLYYVWHEGSFMIFRVQFMTQTTLGIMGTCCTLCAETWPTSRK